jgi:hypothetical protein
MVENLQSPGHSDDLTIVPFSHFGRVIAMALHENRCAKAGFNWKNMAGDVRPLASVAASLLGCGLCGLA